MTSTKSFYSALVINKTLFPGVHQVYRPRYNKEYFKRLTANIDSLEEQVATRCKNSSDRLDKSSLLELKKDSGRFLELKDRIEKVKDDSQLCDAVVALERVENRLMPKVLSIPNRHSKLVPATDTTIGKVDSNCSREGVTRMLSHTKLSYINNCYSKSVVGPNSSYYFGIAARLHYGIRDYFVGNLEQNSFIPMSGLCLAKSALVEAVNGKNEKDYFTDPCRVVAEDSRYTTTHLVEASRESLVGFLTTLGHRNSNKPLRLLTSGSGYCAGSNWFDPDDRRASQFETVHTLVHTPSIEKYSMDEYHTNRDIIWQLYQNLGLPARLIHCSLSSMRSNEFDTHRVDIWLPSRSEWIETARISHYRDYITVRTGMKRGHMIDSTVYDSRALIAAIIENNQTANGQFVIPAVIEEYMPRHKKSLINYEQRRHLVKRSYLFGHSKRAAKNRTFRRNREITMAIILFVLLVMFLDWEVIWIDYVPTNMKRFLYDNIFRPARRFYWSYLYVGGAHHAADLSFDDMDKSHYDETLGQRRKKPYINLRHGARYFDVSSGKELTDDEVAQKVDGVNNDADHSANKVE